MIQLTCTEFVIWFLEGHPDRQSIELDVSESDGVTLEDLFCLRLIQWATTNDDPVLNVNGTLIWIIDRNSNEPIPFSLFEEVSKNTVPYCSFEYLFNRARYAEIQEGISLKMGAFDKATYWYHEAYEREDDIEEKLVKINCDNIFEVIKQIKSGQKTKLKRQALLWDIMFFDSLKTALALHHEDSTEKLLARAQAMLTDAVPRKKLLTKDSVFLSYPCCNLE